MHEMSGPSQPACRPAETRRSARTSHVIIPSDSGIQPARRAMIRSELSTLRAFSLVRDDGRRGAARLT